MEEIKKNNNKLLAIKIDRVFKDMFNESQMDTLEWTVMQILNAKYEDIHGNVKVENACLVNTYPEERNKTVDLLVNYNGDKILIELNNNYCGNYMRNLLYAFNIILKQKKENQMYNFLYSLSRSPNQYPAPPLSALSRVGLARTCHLPSE